MRTIGTPPLRAGSRADKPVKNNEVIERSARIDDARFESRERIGFGILAGAGAYSVTYQLAVRSLDVNLLDLDEVSAVSNWRGAAYGSMSELVSNSASSRLGSLEVDYDYVSERCVAQPSLPCITVMQKISCGIGSHC